MRAGLLWTHLTLTAVVCRLAARGVSACRKVVRRLLGELGFKRRRLVKSVTKAPSRDRDAQFRQVARTRERFRRAGNPVLSMDSKRKESVGPLHRAGEVWADGPAEVLDHDLPSYAEGEVVLHGFYDPARNAAHVNLNLGSDTSEFACASLGWYWREVASAHYPEADALLLLCDCGGSNSYVSGPFKWHLARFAAATGLTVEVAHTPVYCSKYNPIERRAFCHVESALRGRTFGSVGELAAAVRGAHTRTGLETTAHVMEERYTPVRRSKTKHDLTGLPIKHDKRLPDYNYKVEPGQTGQ